MKNKNISSRGSFSQKSDKSNKKDFLNFQSPKSSQNNEFKRHNVFSNEVSNEKTINVTNYFKKKMNQYNNNQTDIKKDIEKRDDSIYQIYGRDVSKSKSRMDQSESTMNALETTLRYLNNTLIPKNNQDSLQESMITEQKISSVKKDSGYLSD